MMRKGNQTAISPTEASLSETQVLEQSRTQQCGCGCHQVEEEVRRQLLSDPNLHFSDLVIRRVPDGVCLEGFLEMNCDSGHISDLAQRVAGVETVLNRLINCPAPPVKG
ncbi:hypothetical protein MNBD_PLANCTO02-356 [hydrothermal vent metagenome]|uniref:BON domain-containing protein n=1 Tax=hydrothermal vent metagenome TaxID=652676 RepID=A0A3B1DVW7_9ZZZZ